MEGTALVTGGAKRIGCSIATALAQKGIRVALHYHSSGSEAESAAREIRSLGGECQTFQCDLNNHAQVASLIPAVINEFPDLHILINNASIFKRVGLMDTDDLTFEQHMNINLKAPFFLIQYFARHCQKGHIINILDTRISKVTTQYFVYGLSKNALGVLTKMAAKALGPDIRVNGIAPGLILPSEYQDKDQFKKMGKAIPLKKTGGPDDVVSALMFFLENDFVTGEILSIDGGEHLK